MVDYYVFNFQQNGLINSGEKHDGEKRESKSRDGLPPHMSFSRTASYNDPQKMFPSTAKLFSGFNRYILHIRYYIYFVCFMFLNNTIIIMSNPFL